jgi:cleavage and polyadenylation specificity factor subunit 2
LIGGRHFVAGDVKLSQLKAALTDAGIPSEWADGALVCRGHTLVTKARDSEDLLLEGALSTEYYAIRDIIYSQYHVC